MARGFMGFFGLGAETSWGTAVAATNFFEIMSENVVTTMDRFPVKNIVANMYEPDDSGGVTHHAGEVVGAGYPSFLGWMLKGAFGTSSVSVILSGSLWRTDFIPANTEWGSRNALPAFTAEIFRDITSSDQFSGVQVSNLQMAIAPNQDLRVTANLIAKAHSVIQASTPTFPSSPAMPFTFDTASLSIGGTAADRIEAMTITLDNQLSGLPALNLSTDIARIHRTNAPQMRLRATIALADYTDYLNFINQTEQRWVLSLTKANSFALIIDMPRVVLTSHPHRNGGRDRVIVEAEAMIRYHSGSANAMKVSLTTVNCF